KSLVHLAMDTGDRYRFGEVTFHSDYFSEKLLRRYLNINESTEFSDTRTLELQEDLDASDYFEEVIIAPTVDHQAKRVPLDITVTPKKKRVFSAGIGYSTDIGMRLSGLGTWRYLNRMGHKFNVDLLLAQKQRRAVFNYRVPGKRPATSYYDFYFKYNYEDTKYRDYTALIIGASNTHKKGGFKQIYAIDYRNDKFRTPEGIRRHTKLLVPSVTFKWDNIVNPIFENWVLKGSIMVRGATKTVGSDVNFVQVKAEGTAAIPITQNNRIILKGQMGHTFISPKDLYHLSPALLFQTGGDNTVRGYRYNGIGEWGYKDKEIYGGKKLMVGSFEWEHKFAKDWAGVAFVDAGDAFNGDKPNFKFGAGMGVRWFSQIGVVKFDIAHGFNRDYGDTFRFHLNIGKEI
ncbi:autotransporter assembly complex protein TamA, partial [Wohlfahrtiimonas larvae]